MTKEEMLQAQLKVLGHEGYGFTEFRNIGINGHTQNFVSINPRKTKDGRKNEDVSYLTCIIVDIDPIRPKDTPSTEEQHNAAIALAWKINQDVPNTIVVDSGSGAHVYFPIIPIPVDDIKTISQSVGQFLEQLREKYSVPGLLIDHIQDPARVIRVWGSHNNKSNRQCVPLNIDGVKEFPRNEFKINPLTKQETSVILSSNEERFMQLCKNNINIERIMKGEGNFPSRSEADYAFIAYLTKAHLSLDDIQTFARRNPLGRGNDLQTKDVERIVSKIQNNDSISKSFIHSTSIYTRNLENRKPGYSTGFPRLDGMLAGLQKGRLYVLAARTNEGKTSFAVQIASNLSSMGNVVLYFPTELGYAPLFDKIIANKTGIPLRQFQFGSFTDIQLQTIHETTSKIQTQPFIVYEDFGLTPQTVQDKAKEICPQVVIIDYLQAFKFETKDTGQQAGEIADIMRNLKQLNEELNVPIVLCCQLNRSAINNELSLSQLKGSGSIEEFSDVVMALSTLSKYEDPRPVDLHILKSRYSEVGKIRFKFHSSIGKFEEETK